MGYMQPSFEVLGTTYLDQAAILWRSVTLKAGSPIGVQEWETGTYVLVYAVAMLFVLLAICLASCHISVCAFLLCNVSDTHRTIPAIRRSKKR
jgi:hypothetical protein